MRSADEQGLKIIATNILDSLRQQAIPHEKSDYQVVTCSIGGCIKKHENDTDLNNFISIVDKNLYKAKNNGRNQLFYTTLS